MGILYNSDIILKNIGQFIRDNDPFDHLVSVHNPTGDDYFRQTYSSRRFRFERHKVDLHLSCHDQNYERTFPLTEVPDNPTPGSTDLNRYAKGKGVIYAKISPSGKKSEIGHQFSQFTTEQQNFMAMRDCTAHHYALVHVKTAGDIVVEVFSVVGDGSPKTLLDTFTISAQ